MKPIPTQTIILFVWLLLTSVVKAKEETKKKDENGPSSRLGGATETTTTTTTTTKTNQDAILIIGDSWASLSGNYLANVCGPSTTRPIQNDAISGSTAKEWAYNRLGVEAIDTSEIEYTHVWLSVGGNDILDKECDMSIVDKVAANVINVIKQVVDASRGEAAVGKVAYREDLKILYFGYSIPSRDVCGQGRTASLYAKQTEIIFEAIRNSDYAEYVTTIDISDMFVTSESSPLSDPSYFADAIHLNEVGYKRLFSGYSVLRFFDCSVVQIAQSHLAKADGPLPIGFLAASAIAVVAIVLVIVSTSRKRGGRTLP
eukprot:scaffold18509_cov158-Skeletonema_menzelii.AAC.4